MGRLHRVGHHPAGWLLVYTGIWCSPNSWRSSTCDVRCTWNCLLRFISSLIDEVSFCGPIVFRIFVSNNIWLVRISLTMWGFWSVVVWRPNLSTYSYLSPWVKVSLKTRYPWDAVYTSQHDEDLLRTICWCDELDLDYSISDCSISLSKSIQPNYTLCLASTSVFGLNPPTHQIYSRTCLRRLKPWFRWGWSNYASSSAISAASTISQSI